MDDHERIEQYLAWRRAEGRDRRGRLRRSARIGGGPAFVALLLAARGGARGRWPGRPGRRGPLRRRARIVGGLAFVALLIAALGVAVGGWPSRRPREMAA